MSARGRWCHVVSVMFFVECAYLLVPWQAVVYGGFDFGLNENLVTWAGAPISYLAARAIWRDEAKVALVVVVASWVWLLAALHFTYDPHGFGPRNFLVLAFIGWIPLANTTSLFFLWLAGTGEERRP